MKKIVLVCFCNQENNLGDQSYVVTFRKLMEIYTEDVNLEMCDFYARAPLIATKEKAKHAAVATDKIHTIRNAIFMKLPQGIKNSYFCKKYLKYRKYSNIYKYYQTKLNDADAVIIPGGGLVEYALWRDYYLLIQMLQKICNKNHINMYINSVGYVENDYTKKWIKIWGNILNNKSVKYFSCRDNLKVFQALRPSSIQIPCSACLSSDVFHLSKNENSNIIGIGLMRPDAYSDYGNDINDTYLLAYYKNTIEELFRRGYKVALFSVGVPEDHYFGEKLIEYMHNENVVLYDRPTDVQTFLHQFSTFKGIITVRTHSAYAAFSLNVPAVMIYFGRRGWSGKSNEFMQMMGVPENAICCDGVSPEELVNKFENALKAGWNQEVREHRKQQCYQNFFEIMQKIGVLKPNLSKNKE